VGADPRLEEGADARASEAEEPGLGRGRTTVRDVLAPKQGLTFVEQLRSSASARSEQASFSKQTLSSFRPGDRTRPLAVPGVPGSRGLMTLAVGVNGGGTFYNITFTDGPYLYFVGAAFGPAAIAGKPGPSKAQLEAATRAVYARVYGR
jgi:hypothetical protein